MLSGYPKSLSFPQMITYILDLEYVEEKPSLCQIYN